MIDHCSLFISDNNCPTVPTTSRPVVCVWAAFTAVGTKLQFVESRAPFPLE